MHRTWNSTSVSVFGARKRFELWRNSGTFGCGVREDLGRRRDLKSNCTKDLGVFTTSKEELEYLVELPTAAVLISHDDTIV
jgi:hypothetical protein